MSDLKNDLQQYYAAASHIDVVTTHLKSNKKTVGYDSDVSEKSPEILEVIERISDLEKHIAISEASLRAMSVDHIPKPVYFDISGSLGQSDVCQLSKLPSVLREAIEAIAEHVQAPVGLAAHAVLSAACHIAQARVDASSQVLDTMPCSLFFLSLGDSGSRKTTCQRLAFKVINEQEAIARREYSKKQRARARDDSSADIERFNYDPQETMSDVVYEGLASHMIRGCPFLTVSSDDAGQWFGGHSLTSPTRAATSAGYIIAFDRGRIERNRSLGNANGSGVAENIRLSVSLMAQEGVVRRSLLDPMLRDQGLLPRFLLFNSESIAGTRLIDRSAPLSHKMSDPRLLRFWERCEERMLIPIKLKPRTRELDLSKCPLNEDAFMVFADYYDYVEKMQGAGGDFEHIPAFASRSAELSLRLATVIAFFDQKNEVDVASMRAAADIALHSLHGWASYLQSNEVPASDAFLAFDLLQKLSAMGMRVFDKRRVQQYGPSYVRRPKNTVTRLLLILEKHGFVFSPEITGTRKYLINPQYLRDKGLG